MPEPVARATHSPASVSDWPSAPPPAGFLTADASSSNERSPNPIRDEPQVLRERAQTLFKNVHPIYVRSYDLVLRGETPRVYLKAEAGQFMCAARVYSHLPRSFLCSLCFPVGLFALLVRQPVVTFSTTQGVGILQLNFSSNLPPSAVTPQLWITMALATLLVKVFGLGAIVLLTQYLLAYLRSPLKKLPGPFLAKFSDLWRFFNHYGQTHIETQKELHAKYGDAVAIGPKTVSVADPSLIKTIYSTRGTFLKVSKPTYLLSLWIDADSPVERLLLHKRRPPRRPHPAKPLQHP